MNSGDESAVDTRRARRFWGIYTPLLLSSCSFLSTTLASCDQKVRYPPWCVRLSSSSLLKQKPLHPMSLPLFFPATLPINRSKTIQKAQDVPRSWKGTKRTPRRTTKHRMVRFDSDQSTWILKRAAVRLLHYLLHALVSLDKSGLLGVGGHAESCVRLLRC